MTSSMPPPGWYLNPSGEPGHRYWDGHNWTIVSHAGPSAPDDPLERTTPHAGPDAGPASTPQTASRSNDDNPTVEGAPPHNTKKQLTILVAVLAAIAAGCLCLALFYHPAPDPAPRATPTRTPEENFIDDMDDRFGEALNPGKDPISDFTDWRTFSGRFAEVGHEICRTLDQQGFDETARQFKNRLPLLNPTDTDSRVLVSSAIDNLCPQHMSRKPQR